MSQKMYNKLRGKIVEKFDTITAFSNELAVSKQSVSNKLKGKSDFSANDIYSWATLLDIDTVDVWSYFFDDKVRKF